MKRLWIWALLVLLLSPLPVQANDYSLAANAVIRGWVPWRVAVFLINGHIGGYEERWRSIGSLVKYKSPGLVPYLKSYANAPEDPIRIAAFWPLYKNGEKEFAMELLRREIQKGNTTAGSVFFTPNAPGSDYKIELTRSDPVFQRFAEDVATDKKIDPAIRIFAAIHLTQIGKGETASVVAKGILAGIAPDPSIKNYNDWPEDAKKNFHLRKHAEWCINILRP